MALVVLYWYEQTYNLEPSHWASFLILMGASAAADTVSWMYGDEHSNTIRDVALVSGGYKFFASAIQLRLQAAILFGHRYMALHFFTAWIVQSTAFTATLNRKNLVNPMYTAWLYTVQLGSGALMNHLEFDKLPVVNRLVPNAIFFIVMILRLGPRFPKPLQFFVHSKYFLWPAVYLMLPYVRPDRQGNFAYEPYVTESRVKIVTAVSFVAFVAMAAWKIPKYPKVESSSSKKAA